MSLSTYCVEFNLLLLTVNVSKPPIPYSHCLLHVFGTLKFIYDMFRKSLIASVLWISLL